jgi:hypothetical protein
MWSVLVGAGAATLVSTNPDARAAVAATPSGPATQTCSPLPTEKLKPIVLTQTATGWLARYIDAFDKHNSLTYLARMFPRMGNAVRQEQYISCMNKYVTPSVAGYQHFRVDMTYRHAFDGQAGYWRYITPKGVVQHWTAIRFRGVRAFISYLNNVRHLRTTYFIDRDGHTYQLFDSDRHMPAGAAGVNSFEQDVEINATGTMDMAPPEILAAEYLMIREARLHGWGIDLSRFPTHTLVDLVFNNPTYNPSTGLFHPAGNQKPYLGKIDPPQELDQVIVSKARHLLALLP